MSGLIRALAISVGYWVRPYDMLADARRWRWQRPQRCGAPREIIELAQRYIDNHK